MSTLIDQTALRSYMAQHHPDADCGASCEHTEEEHDAFDSGLMAGELGEGEEANPYKDFILSHAWLSGHDVGARNR